MSNAEIDPRPSGSGWVPTRVDGWAPIEQYGVLGDGRTVTLVAADGQIDWWPLPALNSPPVFAGLLDPEHGGQLTLRPEAPYTVTRRYVGDSNVLETTFSTADGSVRVTDALSVSRTGRTLPWTELIRDVHGLDGHVAMNWSIQPGTRFGTARPWTEQRSGALMMHCADQHLAVHCFDAGDPTVGPATVTGSFDTAPGSRSMIAVTASDDEPTYQPSRADLQTRLQATVEHGNAWSDALTYDGPWRAAVRRSALALKLLHYQRTGALAAAATTSLPERIGGPKNWDYRYMWVRDASFTVDAFLRLGLHEEVQAALTFILRCVRSSAPHLRVFYTLDGETPGSETTIAAPGYRDSRPVRSGNGAASQTQLGTFGDLFDAVWLYTQAGHQLDPATAHLLADLADRCCDLWQTPDAGIWELHDNRHYTNSKMGCWVALDRALRLHDAGQLSTNHPHRWRQERDAIHTWVHRNCWSPSKKSYTFYAGTDDLDAATLLAGQTGFDRGEHLAGTVDAVRRELAHGSLVYRYSGMDQQEGAFIACSFWLVSALAVLGRHDEATAQMNAGVALANDLGLLAEQADPHDNSMLGNTPQGLSHLALINAAHLLQRPRDHH